MPNFLNIFDINFRGFGFIFLAGRSELYRTPLYTTLQCFPWPSIFPSGYLFVVRDEKPIPPLRVVHLFKQIRGGTAHFDFTDFWKYNSESIIAPPSSSSVECDVGKFNHIHKPLQQIWLNLIKLVQSK